MSVVDRLVEWFDPVAAVRRRAARSVLAYEAAKTSRLRTAKRSNPSINDLVQRDGLTLRAQARHLERNHDIARGILRTLVNNTVGPSGIGVEPQPRRRDGSIHNDYAQALRDAWRDWQRMPEVTGRLTWQQTQRLACRTWIRDGELFSRLVSGLLRTLDHGTRVPLSLELLEPEMVPADYDDPARGVRQGVELNGWGRPIAYHVYKKDPRDSYRLPVAGDIRRVPADRILHLYNPDHAGQIRGASEFASVLVRLDDIKDYEESERVAAKIAARLTAYIRKGTPDMFDPATLARDEAGNPLPRELTLQAGTIIDDLGIGEDVGMINSNRPNPNLVLFRQGQLRAVAAGIGTSYSSISRDYSGTYSSQRQELVEQWVHYATLTDDFTGLFVRPVWEEFVTIADAAGVVPRPNDLADGTEDDALFIGQQMPWIDPVKEASAWEALVRAGFASEVEVMRRRGVNPRDVLEQISSWRDEVAERGLIFTSNAGSQAAASSAAPSDDELAQAVAAVLRGAK